jgi:hypothetical protein
MRKNNDNKKRHKWEHNGNTKKGHKSDNNGNNKKRTTMGETSPR